MKVETNVLLAGFALGFLTAALLAIAAAGSFIVSVSRVC